MAVAAVIYTLVLQWKEVLDLMETVDVQEFQGAMVEAQTMEGMQAVLAAAAVALMKVVGAYGIVVMCKDDPETIIAARFGSPLLLGIGDNEYFVASDSSPIIEYTRNIIFLDEGELAVIHHDSFEVRNISGNHVVSKNVEEIKYNLEEIEKGGYDHFMLKEICEQPESLRDILRGRLLEETGDARLGGITLSDEELARIRRIVITACAQGRDRAFVVPAGKT